MSTPTNNQVSVFLDQVLQRMIICDPSGRWLGAIRGALDEMQRRAVVPSLDLQDAVRQAENANQALVVFYVSSDHPQKAIEQIHQNRLARHVLLFAVCDPVLSPWRLALVEAGCTRVFTSLLQLDDLIKSAGQFFNAEPPVRFSWQQLIQARMPWPAWSPEKDPIGKP